MTHGCLLLTQFRQPLPRTPPCLQQHQHQHQHQHQQDMGSGNQGSSNAGSRGPLIKDRRDSGASQVRVRVRVWARVRVWVWVTNMICMGQALVSL